MKTKIIIILLALSALCINVTARYYDPDTGRFISADTVTPGGGADLQGLNRYSYCRNNPVKYVDPTGHEEQNSPFVVPFKGVSFSESLNQLTTNQKEAYLFVVRTALEHVAANSPKGNTPFKWAGDKNSLKNKSLTFYITTESDGYYKNIAPIGGVPKNTGVQGATIATYNSLTKKEDIFLNLFLDNIYFENNKQLSDLDGLSNMMVVLAHELYGNVKSGLELKSTKEGSIEERVDWEIKAFQAGINFVDRFLNSKDFKSRPNEVRSKWSKSLRNVQKEHKEILKGWKDEKAKLDSLKNEKKKSN